MREPDAATKQQLQSDFNKGFQRGVNDLVNHFNKGRDEAAQALKSFPESIGHSNYQEFYGQEVDKAMETMQKEKER